jgi:hypothetical protein
MRKLIVLLLCCLPAVGQVIDRTQVMDYLGTTTVGNPAAGSGRMYFNPNTGLFVCLTSSGANACPGGGGSSVTWAGDLLGSNNTTQTVIGINGVAIPVSAGVIGTNSSGQLVSNTGTLTNNISGNALTATTATSATTATTATSATTATTAGGISTTYSPQQLLIGPPSGGSAAAPTAGYLAGSYIWGCVDSQSGTAYTVGTGDQSCLIPFTPSASAIITLPNPAATPAFGCIATGACFTTTITNEGTFPLAVTPISPATIDGLTTISLNQYQSAQVYSDGTNWWTQRGSGLGLSSNLVTNNIPVATSSTGIGPSLLTDTGSLLSYTGVSGFNVSGQANIQGNLTIGGALNTAGSLAITSPIPSGNCGISAAGFSVLCINSSGQLSISINGGSQAPIGGGGITSIATTAPLSGGPITTTGTISCPTCVTNSSKTCTIIIGADNGSALGSSDLNQKNQCFFSAASTIVEVDVEADAAAGSSPTAVSVSKVSGGVTTNLFGSTTTLPVVVTTGAVVCARSTTSASCYVGTSSSSVSLSTTAVAAGDWITLNNGAADGTSKRLSVAITYTVN